ncbi:hypothetical protein L3556_05925 [Candidatus Synechococcus calcipolaris G9]|uniref:Uncharacterized protein n=1 Tax=Candidatus Synechococcus calcipolaris G9 TaxID=1497997 RepID=A0ABT6EYL7_9SYNE|nr:hypothetical protein [Candidatus Synechococcus calcipolaris]MDG2990472.1 hypothetical protein [Candidatus Synechococcus calcipolaris G9]
MKQTRGFVKIFKKALILAILQSFGYTQGIMAQSVPRLRAGRLYPEIREQLINRGWQPIVNEELLEATTTTPVVAHLLRQNYTELISCLPIGIDVCAFQFRNRRGDVLEISTVHLPITPDGTLSSWALRRVSR